MQHSQLKVWSTAICIFFSRTSLFRSVYLQLSCEVCVRRYGEVVVELAKQREQKQKRLRFEPKQVSRGKKWEHSVADRELTTYHTLTLICDVSSFSLFLLLLNLCGRIHSGRHTVVPGRIKFDWMDGLTQWRVHITTDTISRTHFGNTESCFITRECCPSTLFFPQNLSPLDSCKSHDSHSSRSCNTLTTGRLWASSFEQHSSIALRPLWSAMERCDDPHDV